MAARACIVIGGRGFVGRCLTSRLLEETESGSHVWSEVRVLDMAKALIPSEAELASETFSEASKSGRLTYVSADIREKDQVTSACKGVSVVFHMASLGPDQEDFTLNYAVNVLGTKNVIAACLASKVGALIFTSSASVVFDGTRDIKGADESIPYASKHMSLYSETKAQAEALVLAADTKAGLRTCALRPSNVFGPGDTLAVPAIAKAAAAGKLKFVLGDATNKADWTFVDNVVEGHICAEKTLRAIIKGTSNGAPAALSSAVPTGPKFGRQSSRRIAEEAAGKAYFVTNDEPMIFWDFIVAIATGFGYDVKPIAHIPASLIIALATVVHSLYLLLKPLGLKPSDFTPYRMKLATRWRVFSCSRAERLLGYSPVVNMKDAIQNTLAAYPGLHRDAYMSAQAAKRDSSKVRASLGGGAVADILLWRHPLPTLLVLLGLLLMMSGIASASSPLSSAASCMMILMLMLFCYDNIQSAAATYLHVELPDVSSAPWTVPPTLVSTVVDTLLRIASLFPIYSIAHSLMVLRSSTLYLKVMLGLLLTKAYLGHLHVGTFIFLGTIAAFVLPPLIENLHEAT